MAALLVGLRRDRSRALVALRVQLGGGGRDRLLGRLGAIGRTLDLEHLHVGQAEEAEHALEIRKLEVERVAGARIDAAARRNDDHLLAADETFRSLLAVAEGAAGAR